MDRLSPLFLVCTRLCHDLAGPIGALDTGAALLEEDMGSGVGVDDQTVELMAESARAATIRLRFLRLVTGRHTTGFPPMREALQLATDFLALGNKVLELDNADFRCLDELSSEAKQALLLCLISACDIWPRATTIDLITTDEPIIEIQANGKIEPAGDMWHDVLADLEQSLTPKTSLLWLAARLSDSHDLSLVLADDRPGVIRMGITRSNASRP